MYEELLSPLFSFSWGRRVVLFAFFSLWILIFGTVVAMVVKWNQDARLANFKPKVMQNIASNARLDDLIVAIPTWHLFGASVTGALPITSLQITLLGINQAVPANASTVILSEENQSGKVYRVGDMLAVSHVTVYSITMDGVVLKNGERLEKLLLNRPPLLFKGLPESFLDHN